MILVDTSVWISYLRQGNYFLAQFLDASLVACHPWIIGELACGSIRNRIEFLTLVEALPKTEIAEHIEILEFTENHQLMNKGLGYIDIHLLVSAILTGIPLWTFDKKLANICKQFNVLYSPD